MLQFLNTKILTTEQGKGQDSIYYI